MGGYCADSQPTKANSSWTWSCVKRFSSVYSIAVAAGYIAEPISAYIRWGNGGLRYVVYGCVCRAVPQCAVTLGAGEALASRVGGRCGIAGRLGGAGVARCRSGGATLDAEGNGYVARCHEVCDCASLRWRERRAMPQCAQSRDGCSRSVRIRVRRSRRARNTRVRSRVHDGRGHEGQ